MRDFSDHTISELLAQGIEFNGYSAPGIVETHIDGPLLYFSDGQIHWLTIPERIQLWFGLTNAEKLQCKLRPRLVASLEVYWQQGEKYVAPSGVNKIRVRISGGGGGGGGGPASQNRGVGGGGGSS